MGWAIGQSGSIPARSKIFSLFHCVCTRQWIERALLPAIKRLLCEADHSPPFTGEVKNDGAIFLLPDMP
jgi:hypothetical protein